MDKVFVDRVVTVVVFVLLILAVIWLHVENREQHAHFCPNDRLTRLCVD